MDSDLWTHQRPEHRREDPSKTLAKLGIGSWGSPCYEKLLHKFSVTDKCIAIMGSLNWLASAASTYDEALLVIHSPQLAKHFTREMDRLWRGAELGVNSRIRKKLERQRAKCGSGEQRPAISSAS